MNFLKQSFSLRIISTVGIPLLCVLFAAVMAKGKGSNGLVRKKPSVVLQASKISLTLACPPGWFSRSRSCSSAADFAVALTSIAKGLSKPTHSYTVAGGQIIGEGSNVTWDLNGVGPGSYTATVEVQDNKKRRTQASVIVTIGNCADCSNSEWCPAIVVSCYDQVMAGTAITCKAEVRPWLDFFTLEWSVHDSNGENLAARISRRDPYISIRTEGLGGLAVRATVEVKGVEAHCSRTSSGFTVVKP